MLIRNKKNGQIIEISKTTSQLFKKAKKYHSSLPGIQELEKDNLVSKGTYKDVLYTYIALNEIINEQIKKSLILEEWEDYNKVLRPRKNR